MAADGSVIIDTRMDTTGVQNGVSAIKQSFNGLGSAVKKIGLLIGGAFAVGKLVQFGKECVELGSDLAEVQNVVDVTFTTMSDKVNEFAKNAMTSAGLSETMAKRYVGTFGAMSKSFGLSDDGKFKGLYYEKDESGNQTLFISFNAMKGGVISLGGTNNGNGQLKIYDADGKQVSRLGYTGYVVLNKNTGNPMVSLNTAGLRLYTDYTDSENYNALMLGKYGLYAQKVQNNVPELWMEGDTSKKWEGYIVRYLNNKVRINTNSLFTDGCELGANFSTDGSATVGKGLSVGGNATVDGTLMFYDLQNQAKTSGKVKRQPVASVSAVGSQVAYFSSGKGAPAGSTATYRRLGVCAQWGGTSSAAASFATDYLYTGTQVSDIRLKDNIKNSTTTALETVNQMKVRQFDWKKERGGWHQNIGFVADELEEIDPNLALGGGYDENGEMDIKQINSPYLLNYAIKAIQELSAKVGEQEKRIKELERRLQ